MTAPQLFDLSDLGVAVPDDWQWSLVIRVTGVPQPAGSKSGFATFRKVDGQRVYTGNIAVVDSGTAASRDRHKSWRALVAEAAQEAMAGADPWLGAVLIRSTFTMPRPKSHYGTGRNEGVLKVNAPTWHVSKPDRGKIERSVEDSLKDGGVYKDDTQTCVSQAFKVYTRPPQFRLIADAMPIPGVVVRLWRLP